MKPEDMSEEGILGLNSDDVIVRVDDVDQMVKDAEHQGVYTTAE
jgi:hypothetical protein